MEDNQYRIGVGAVIINSKKQILMFERRDKRGWQLPQGGLNPGESDIDGLFREVKEETGLDKKDLTVLAETQDFIPYDIPVCFMSERYKKGKWKGQKEKWFLLQSKTDNPAINLNNENPPEFIDYKWGSVEDCLSSIVDFKKDMYVSFFKCFENYLK